jgi:hypothetical protein
LKPTLDTVWAANQTEALIWKLGRDKDGSGSFCFVPHSVRGLESLRRVPKPGGELRMFEHTGSHWVPFKKNLYLDVVKTITAEAPA